MRPSGRVETKSVEETPGHIYGRVVFSLLKANRPHMAPTVRRTDRRLSRRCQQ